MAGSDVVIGYDTASWRLAERGWALGRRFILVHTSVGYPASLDRLFLDLRRQFPEWADDFPPRLRQLSAGEESEQRQAHRIGVAGSFSRPQQTGEGISPARVDPHPPAVITCASSARTPPP